MESENLKEIFDSEDFDPIDYINEKFPDEKSLINLDDEILLLKRELNEMNKELIQSIHDHALDNSDLKREIQESKNTTLQVIDEIKIIKEKAEKSEHLVYEMCKDIKSLDTAKRNLTFSITALKKFIMLMTAVDKLRENCETRNYREVGNLYQAIEELQIYFLNYQDIPQIKDLQKEKEDIIKHLKQQIQEDFVDFAQQNTHLTVQTMHDACITVEILGIQFKNLIVGKICGMVLNGYQKSFESPENSQLEQYERRFTWLGRALKEYEAKWNGVFPEYWGMQAYLIYEFCGLTRSNVKLLLDTKPNQDVQLLMKCLSYTISFEQKFQKDMEKRYQQYLYVEEEEQLNQENNELDQNNLQEGQQKQKQGNQNKSNNDEKQNPNKYYQKLPGLPKFRGSMSDVYSLYLKPYTDQEERELREYIQKILKEDVLDTTADFKVFNSSLYMFNYIKALIKRASQYSRTQIMRDIAAVIQQALSFYQSELVNIIMREERQPKKNENNYYNQVCFAINTAEYCKDTIQGLEDSIKQNLDPPFNNQIDLNSIEDSFVETVNKGIDSLQSYLFSGIDVQLRNILNAMNNEKMNDEELFKYAGNATQQICNQIKNQVAYIREFIGETYLLFYLNKIVLLINKKFLENVYKSKKIGENLVVDCTELENCLKQFGKQEENKVNMSYINFVKKTFNKTKNTIKILNQPKDLQEKFSLQEFYEAYKNLLEDMQLNEIQQIFNHKNIRSIDPEALYQKLQQKQ